MNGSQATEYAKTDYVDFYTKANIARSEQIEDKIRWDRYVTAIFGLLVIAFMVWHSYRLDQKLEQTVKLNQIYTQCNNVLSEQDPNDEHIEIRSAQKDCK